MTEQDSVLKQQKKKKERKEKKKKNHLSILKVILFLLFHQSPVSGYLTSKIDTKQNVMNTRRHIIHHAEGMHACLRVVAKKVERNNDY